MSRGRDEGTLPRRHLPIRVYAALFVAVLAISSSAVLVRWADADPVALAFWRTLAGAAILAIPARRARVRPTRAQWPLLIGAGIALGLHFSSWLASLELTSVAASVTLVSVAPLVIAFVGAISGRRPSRRSWIAVAIALAGTVVITAGDLGGGDDALIGDGLALVGAVCMACYLMIGDRLRTSLPTAVYASRVYLLAACSLVPALLVFRIPIWGYDRTTTLAIIGMVLGPQLAGHTVLNALLKPLGSLAISLSLLVEPLGASVLVWLALGDVPPIGAVIGAPIVLFGLGLHLLDATGRSRSEPVRR